MRRLTLVSVILLAVCGGAIAYIVLARGTHGAKPHFRLTIRQVGDHRLRLDVRQVTGGCRLRIAVTTASLDVTGERVGESSVHFAVVPSSGSEPHRDGYAPCWSQTYSVDDSALEAGRRYAVSASAEAREKGLGAYEGGCPLCGFTLKTARPAMLVAK